VTDPTWDVEDAFGDWLDRLQQARAEGFAQGVEAAGSALESAIEIARLEGVLREKFVNIVSGLRALAPKEKP